MWISFGSLLLKGKKLACYLLLCLAMKQTRHRIQTPSRSKAGNISYVSGFLEGKFFLNQGIPVPETLLWATNDFARGFRAGYFGDEVIDGYRHKTVASAASKRRDRRNAKR